jgi:hypothetical protein
LEEEEAVAVTMVAEGLCVRCWVTKSPNSVPLNFDKSPRRSKSILMVIFAGVVVVWPDKAIKLIFVSNILLIIDCTCLLWMNLLMRWK